MNVLRLVGLCFCAAGLVTAGIGGWLLNNRIKQVHTWLPVDAQVLESNAVLTPGTESDQAAVAYEIRYAVAGTSYTSAFKTSAYSIEESREKAARHPAGSTHRVFYNPADPKEVDANLGLNSATLAAGVGVAGAGVCALLFGLMFVVLSGSGGSTAVPW